MIINVISDQKSWINKFLPEFLTKLQPLGNASLVHSPSDLRNADITFILSFFSLLSAEELSRSRHNLVVHESDLPAGRGWSPLTWQVLEGKSRIPVVLFEATPQTDRGKIYLKQEILLEGNELVDDLRRLQAAATFDLCLKFLTSYPGVLANGKEQLGDGTKYARRTPEDSRVDPNKSIAEQFNLLRVVDNDAYPAFFEHAGERFFLKIERAGKK